MRRFAITWFRKCARRCTSMGRRPASSRRYIVRRIQCRQIHILQGQLCVRSCRAMLTYTTISPAHGAMLSLLAMDLKLQTPTGGTLEDLSEETPSLTPGGKDHKLGPVIGAAVGGLVIIITFLVLLFFYRRRRRNYAPPVHLNPFRVPPLTSSSAEYERENTSSTALLPLSGKNRSTSNPPDSSVIFRKPRLELEESPEPVAAVQPTASTSQVNSRGLHGEVEDLRREMDRLRTDGLMLPPSYDMGRV